MVYDWRTIDYEIPAQQVGEHMEELDKIHGEITPQIMVDDARPAEALMHPLYDWDDFRAAEKYRCYQAKKIRSNLIVVKVEKPNIEIGKQTPVCAFISVKPRNESASYRPTMVAMSDEKTREIVLENAKAELRSFDMKYRGLLDVAKLMSDFVAENYS